MTTLSKDDVSRLLADPSAETRALTAAKVGAQLDNRNLTEDERRLAEAIVRVMARDAAIRVRQALAESLKTAVDVPHDVARQLAFDVDAVALPVLEFSTVLTEADLVQLVTGSANETKMTAVARRDGVSAALADALIEHGGEGVVATLVANERAEIAEASLGRAVDRFGGSEAVQGSLVSRPRLPLTIAERLVTLVSDTLRDRLVANQSLDPAAAADLLMQSRERATVGLIGRDTNQEDLERLVAQLHGNGRLTASLILRAVCTGDIAFFEASLARMAAVPVLNARLLIHDGGQLGFQRLYDKAGLPANLFAVFRTAVDVSHETEMDDGEHGRERYRARMIERILTQVEDMGSEDADYLLRKLSDLHAMAA